MKKYEKSFRYGYTLKNKSHGLFHWDLNSWVCIYYKGVEFYVKFGNITRISL